MPLVADIHFQPAVAMMVADAFEKIRVNPGNFADGRKTFEVINYDDPAQFRAEQEHIREARLLLQGNTYFTPNTHFKSSILDARGLSEAMRLRHKVNICS